MEFTVRKMEPTDIQQVQTVARLSWNATYSGIIPTEVQENFLHAAYNDEMMHRRLDCSRLYVAELKGRIVGFANFSNVHEDGAVELSAIYLNPEFKGKEIGSALLQEGIKHSHGLKEVYINVEQENQIGRKFYEAKKFVAVSEFEDRFEGHMLTMVRMVLRV